jgi:Mlc titration factor MtfA (ptsG expression regulator)
MKQWFRRLIGRERARIPDELWQSCTTRLPFLSSLPTADDARLKALSEQLLDTKTVTGADGLEVTDEMAVLIAAQACLLVLNLTLDLYDDMAGIIVYPSAFIVPMSEMDEAGVVHEWQEPLSGEAMHAGGAVVLSWEDASGAVPAAAPYNVVIHEFAHKIDMDRGSANGCPPFLPALHPRLDGKTWRDAFSEAYENFCERVDSLDARLPADFDEESPVHAALYGDLMAVLPMDPYAAHHPAEFFAVASEAFFVRPEPLAQQYPRVFALLAEYYRQDPLQRDAIGAGN